MAPIATFAIQVIVGAATAAALMHAADKAIRFVDRCWTRD